MIFVLNIEGSRETNSEIIGNILIDKRNYGEYFFDYKCIQKTTEKSA